MRPVRKKNGMHNLVSKYRVSSASSCEHNCYYHHHSDSQVHELNSTTMNWARNLDGTTINWVRDLDGVTTEKQSAWWYNNEAWELNGTMKMERLTAQWWDEHNGATMKMSMTSRRWRWVWRRKKGDERGSTAMKMKMKMSSTAWRRRWARLCKYEDEWNSAAMKMKMSMTAHEDEDDYNGAIKMRVSSAEGQ